jgi:hypothetical protein
VANDGEQAVAADIAHHQVRLAIGDTDVMDRHDVGMLHRGGRAGLHEEPVADLRILEQLGSDHLDRDVPVEVQLPRAVDDTHAASTDDRFDATPSEERAW